VALGEHREDLVQPKPYVVDVVDRESGVSAKGGGDHSDRGCVPGSKGNNHLEVIVVDDRRVEFGGHHAEPYPARGLGRRLGQSCGG
jgi:hypothetical protein